MYKILIASDRSEVITHLRIICENHGFNICGEANNLEQSLTFSELHIPNIIIFSFHCSVRRQAGVVSKITSLGPSVNVLVYSSEGPNRATQAFIRAGVSGFLSAQRSDEELIAILHGMMAGFTVVPISVLRQPRVKLAHRPAATFLQPAPLSSSIEEESGANLADQDVTFCSEQEPPMLPLICFNEP